MPKRKASTVRAGRQADPLTDPRARMYDVAIVGGGMAGLYAAEEVLRRKPDARVILIESRARLGGRAFNADFEGCSVQTGAGVGRAGKDALLEALLRRHRLPVRPSASRLQYARNGCISDDPGVDARALLQQMGQPTARERQTMDFEQFLAARLRPADAERFRFAAGFDDYLKADVRDALSDYGFEDTLPEGRIFGVPWNVLTARMAAEIRRRGGRVLTGTRVTELGLYGYVPHGQHWELKTARRRGAANISVPARRVLLALPAAPARLLLAPRATPATQALLAQVHGQPFARLYVRVDPALSREFTRKITRETVSAGPLRKTIPIDPARGVYMLAYCDNARVATLKRLAKLAGPARRHAALERIIARDLGIAQVKIVRSRFFFWPAGTHYNAPLTGAASRDAFLAQVRHPAPGVALCGEAFSRGQGWVEGALQSVHDVLDDDDEQHKFLRW